MLQDVIKRNINIFSTMFSRTLAFGLSLLCLNALPAAVAISDGAAAVSASDISNSQPPIRSDIEIFIQSKAEVIIPAGEYYIKL